MKLTIGENIRTLRRERNLSQEELATVFGVSYQSVSRWENDLCYPDLELIPDIAAFFGITVDKLMGTDKGAEQREVDGYLERFQEAISHGDIEACIRIAREGVSVYPSNYRLLNKLMYALFAAGSDDGNIPNWKENTEQYDSEITSLGERIMKYCPDPDIRAEAAARLAFNHCEMGRTEAGRRIYETLPELEYSRELNIAPALSREEKIENARLLIKKGEDILQRGIYALTHLGCLTDKEAAAVYEKSFRLTEILWDGQNPPDLFRAALDHCELARISARLGETECAMEELLLGASLAQAFDKRPDVTTYTSLLMGKRIVTRTESETSDSRSLVEIMRVKWLSSPDFDALRDGSDFQSLLSRLV